MTLSSLDALTARAFAEVQLTADDVAARCRLTRAQVDAYLAAPASTPYPVRVELALLVAQTATDPAAYALAELLTSATVAEIRARAAEFGATLPGIPAEEREAALDEFLRDRLMVHPAHPALSVAAASKLLGADVAGLFAAMPAQDVDR